ncbi:MAG TPA: hypothetical protein VJC09_00465 [Candidatus Saccharimonadales bacterium]|nr:hypothetical protein [Candidatus Saccharimonadales bacterium]
MEGYPKPAEEPFEGLTEDIVDMMNFRPSSPDDRVSPFDLSEEELRYLYGETDEIPDSLRD